MAGNFTLHSSCKRERETCCSVRAGRTALKEGLRRLAMAQQGVIAERAKRMRQAAGQGINAGGVSIRLFGHPAACFAMDEAAAVTDFEDLRLEGGYV
jgi:hypothetical protein